MVWLTLARNSDALEGNEKLEGGVETQAMATMLGADIVDELNALVAQGLARMQGSALPRALDDHGEDALVDLLIGMIVTALEREHGASEFVSHLDNCAERLRSAGMARLIQSRS